MQHEVEALRGPRSATLATGESSYISSSLVAGVLMFKRGVELQALLQAVLQVEVSRCTSSALKYSPKLGLRRRPWTGLSL